MLSLFAFLALAPAPPLASAAVTPRCVQSTVLAGSTGTIVTGVPTTAGGVATKLIALDDKGADRAVQALEEKGKARPLTGTDMKQYPSTGWAESGVTVESGLAPHWRYVTTSEAAGGECVASTLVRVDAMKLSSHYALLVPADANVISLTVYFRDAETGGEAPCATWSTLGTGRRQVTCSFSDMVVTLEPTDRAASKPILPAGDEAGPILAAAERGVSFRCANGDDDGEPGICRVEIRTKAK